jgi:hypothetical protein
MDMFVYIRGAMRHGLDEVEDAIEEALGEAGEVTGSGTGSKGSNIDIEITDDSIDVVTAVRMIQKVLTSFDLPPSSVIVVGGKEHPVRC